MLRIVNITPGSLSGETNQDSEPNIAVNPEKTTDMVATAFTPAPGGGANAPVYVSTDGGDTWSLNTIVPGAGNVGTGDITVAFATTGGMLYAGTLNGSTGKLNILRTSAFGSSTLMTLLVDRDHEDQPWVVAGSIVVNGASKDRVFVGNEDGNQPHGQTATVDVSQDAAATPAPAGFSPIQLERRSTVPIASLGRGKDGPPIRTALHSSGVVYCAFQRWASGTFPNLSTDIVVTRDDNWGASATPFAALFDSGDSVVGQKVATNRFIKFNDKMGQERLGSDLAIAVNPGDSSAVYIAWADRVGGSGGTDWTLHVSKSTDSGQTWSADLRTITNAKNPALAINSAGMVGFLYQQFTGTTWDSKLELSSDGWVTAVTPLVLQTVTSSAPTATFLPYIGDYVRLIAVGADFYGVFCGNNTPNNANFPNGVAYQRGADWVKNILLDMDGTTPVAVSIDPFFFHWSADSSSSSSSTSSSSSGSSDSSASSGSSSSSDSSGSSSSDSSSSDSSSSSSGSSDSSSSDSSSSDSSSSGSSSSDASSSDSSSSDSSSSDSSSSDSSSSDSSSSDSSSSDSSSSDSSSSDSSSSDSSSSDSSSSDSSSSDSSSSDSSSSDSSSSDSSSSDGGSSDSSSVSGAQKAGRKRSRRRRR